MCVVSEAQCFKSHSTHPNKHNLTTRTYTHSLSPCTHTHTHGVHTHRAPPCFPSAVSVLLYTTPSHPFSWTQKTLVAPISLMIPLFLTLWSFPASRRYLSVSLTTFLDPLPSHELRQCYHQHSKDGAKLEQQLRSIFAISFNFWKG